MSYTRIVCIFTAVAALGWMFFWFFIAAIFMTIDMGPQDIEGHPTLGEDWVSIVELIGIGLVGVPVIYASWIGLRRTASKRLSENSRPGFPVVLADDSSSRLGKPDNAT